MKVDIEKIFKLVNDLKQINVKKLSDIEFYENGERVHISREKVKDWEDIGLNNTEFITSRYYREQEEE